MKRDLTMLESIQEQEAKRSEEAYNYALTQTSDVQINEVVQHAFDSMIEHARQDGSEAEIENHGNYVADTVHHLFMNESLRKSLGVGNQQIVKQLQEQEAKIVAADCTQPQTRSLLEKILGTGDREIVERLQEQEAKIAAADCTQAQFGRLVDAYYVPLLLSALALSDEEFDAEYPGENHVSSEQRQELAQAIQEHSKDCPRCSIKFSSDMEWDEHVNRVFSRAKHHPRMYV